LLVIDDEQVAGEAAGDIGRADIDAAAPGKAVAGQWAGAGGAGRNGEHAGGGCGADECCGDPSPDGRGWAHFRFPL
jgi:hypothetical protein